MLRQHKWETNEGEKRSRVVIRCNKYSVPKFEKGKRVGSDELDAAKNGDSNEEHRPVTVTSGGSKEDIPF
jgi:single-stranded DNA-binding protein